MPAPTAPNVAAVPATANNSVLLDDFFLVSFSVAIAGSFRLTIMKTTTKDREIFILNF
jgi:hypothetical protein